MKFAWINLLFVLITTSLYSQVKNVISTSGETYTSDGITLEWTLGEVFINENLRSEMQMNEGFLASSEETFSFALLADLSVEILDRHMDSLYFPNDLIELSVEVSNIGDIGAASSFGKLYLSRDSLIDDNDLEFGFYVIDELGNQESVSIDREFSIPSDLAPGTYFVIVQIDVFDSINEYYDDNNIGILGIKVDNLEDAPDLLIASYEIDQTVKLQDSTTIAIEIKNNGKSGSSTSELTYHISSDDQLDSSDYYIGFSPLDPIAAFTSLEFDETFVISDSSFIGDKYLIIYADGLAKVREVNELNNRIVIPITIKREDQTTSTNDLFLPEDIVITPNPATNMIRISKNIDLPEYNYRIYNSIGVMMKKGVTSNDILINYLPNGLYFLSIYDRFNQILITQFVKTNH